MQLLDTFLLRLINEQLAHPSLDDLMLFLSHSWLWLPLGVITAGICIWKKIPFGTRTFILLLILGVLSADQLNARVLKPYFARERPCHADVSTRRVENKCGGIYSFPSNHATNAMAIAVILALVFRSNWSWFFYLCAVLIGYSRVYLGVHYPSDVIFGFFEGGVLGYYIYKMARRMEQKRKDFESENAVKAHP